MESVQLPLSTCITIGATFEGVMRLHSHPSSCLNVQVHFIVAACENMISGQGMRPGDILTASNGKTIEVGGFYSSFFSFSLVLQYIISL